MAKTETRPVSGTPGGPNDEAPPSTEVRSRLDHPIVWIGAALVVLLIFAWGFLADPSRTAATRDPAWYTWRAGLIAHGDPGSVAGDWGPFHMFGGGYRVSVPMIGAFLQSAGGTGASSFAGFMMVLMPVLAGLALAAGAYRSTKDWVLSILTMFVVGAFFLTTPYVGYLDNLFVLLVLSALVAFLEPARRSWGARSAVFLLALLAMFTHPTTCVVFLGVMFAVLGWHLLSMGFKVREVLDRDLPALLAVFSGFILGGILWVGGKLFLWGVAGNLADAALPPPYTKEFFLERLWQWVGSQFPLVTIPLVIIAVAWIAMRSWRDAKPADAYRTMAQWWLLPYLASVLFIVMGSVVPYYRFFNSTAAIMPLVAIGLWVIIRWILNRLDASKGLKIGAGLAITVLLAGGFAYTINQGLETTQWNDPENQWIDQPTREALASAEVIIGAQPDRPVVFVNNYAKAFQAYGWSKTFSNVARSGLAGGEAERVYQYFGDLEPFLAGERTISNPDCNDILDEEELELKLISGGEVEGADGEMVKQPARTECAYDLVSRGFLDEMNLGVEEHGGTPIVFMVKGFQDKSDNLVYFSEDAPQPEGATLTPLGPEVFLVQGDGLAQVDQADIDAATAAGAAEKARLADHPGLFDEPLHLLRVLLTLLLLLVVPGLIAAPWFGLKDWHQKLGLVAPVSLAMNILMGILVISVTRSSFGLTPALVTFALSIGLAFVLRWMAAKREAEKRVPYAFEPLVDENGNVESDEAFQERRARLLQVWTEAGIGYEVDAETGAITQVIRGVGARAARLRILATKAGDMIDAMGVPFRKKSFRSLMLTQYISMAGDGVVAATILTAVMDPRSAKTGRDLLAIVFLTYLPFVLVAPFVGVVADKYDRRKLLVIVNYARAVFMVLAATTLLLSVDAIPMLSALALLVLGGFRLTLLVKGAALPDSVGGQDLLLANSLSQAGGTLFQAAGGVGAFVLAKFMPAGVVAFSAVVLYFVAGRFARGVLQAATYDTVGFGVVMRGMFRSVADGFKELTIRPAAVVGILSFWAARMLMFGFIGLSLSFATFETITGGEAGGGALDLVVNLGFGAIGAIVGLVLAQYFRDRVAPARLIMVFMVAAGLAALLAPFGPGRLVATFFAGLAFFLVKVAADTVTQQALPDDFRGRAYALFDITYALSYALPAAVLYMGASANIDLDWMVAGFGALVIVIALGLGAWSRKLGLFERVSDDLEGEELEEGIVA